jgi:hypothetical protein
MKENTVQHFLNKCLFNYQQTHKMPLYQIKAVEKMMACRTVALGGHAVYCEEGHLNGVWYNSCRHRGYPQCSAMKTERWLQQAGSLLLDCTHHHWVFTLPHDLLGIWRFNRSLCHTLLFQSVNQTIKKRSADKQYLGAAPGMLLALHTWARNLTLHPHIHCLISHGGLDKAGQWQTPKRKSFLPARVMKEVFRGKFLEGIRTALKAGELVVPTDMTEQGVINLCNKLGRKEWVIHCVKPYQHGSGVAKYLARYIRGGAIKNTQIIKVTEDKVRSRYKSHQTKQTEYLNLKHDEFMQRLLNHIPIPKKQQYQFVGIYHGCCREKLNKARAHMGQEAVIKVDKIDWKDYVASKGEQQCCKECGKALTRLIDIENMEETKPLDFLTLH